MKSVSKAWLIVAFSLTTLIGTFLYLRWAAVRQAKQAEVFLADLAMLQVGASTFEDVQRVAERYPGASRAEAKCSTASAMSPSSTVEFSHTSGSVRVVAV